MMGEFWHGENYDCGAEHEIAGLNLRLLRGELTAAEHSQALRDLDPMDERLIGRMTAFTESAQWTA